MLLLLNLLLLPPLLLALILLYFSLFGGPLQHHYLYTSTVAGPTATPAAEAAVDAALAPGPPSSSSSSMTNAAAAAATASSPCTAAAAAAAVGHGSPFFSSSRSRTPTSAVTSLRRWLLPRKNNRSLTLISTLHRIRVFLLGSDERTPSMRTFRRVQASLWRLYKKLHRRLSHTGELERMISEASLTMIPQGNCLTGERVGFHPHLIAISVRIAAYMRSSVQLREVLALEEQQARQEGGTAQRRGDGGSSSGGGNGAGGISTALHQPSSPSLLDDDEDDTPLSTPALAAMHGNLEPPTFALGGMAGGVAHPVPLHGQPGVASATSSSSSSSSYIPSFVRPFSTTPPALAAFSSAANGFSSKAAGSGLNNSSSSAQAALASGTSLSHPPALHLSSSGDDNEDSSTNCGGGGVGGHYTAAQDARANHLLQLLVAVKCINRTSPLYASTIRPVLYRALMFRNEVADFLQNELEPALAIRYDSSNAAHEKWLMELWSVYLPAGPSVPSPPARITPDWGLLGFQGSDPATDFRGMGVLGLRNLLEFGRHAPIHAGLIMRRAQEQGTKWFGMSITGIALTADLVTLARNHELDAYFYAHGANWNTWHALYATMFVKFDEFWQEAKPENVMSYGSVHSAFLSSFALEARSFPFSPRDALSKDFSLSAITPVTPRHHASSRSACRTPLVEAEEDDGAVGDDEEDELEREIGATRVAITAGSPAAAAAAIAGSRRSSKGALATTTLSRASSMSPLSLSARSRSRSVSMAGGGVSRSGRFDDDDDDGMGGFSGDDSHSASPLSLSRSDDLLDGLLGGGLDEPTPLGSWLDPIVPPKTFARYKLPEWTAKQ